MNRVRLLILAAISLILFASCDPVPSGSPPTTTTTSTTTVSDNAVNVSTRSALDTNLLEGNPVRVVGTIDIDSTVDLPEGTSLTFAEEGKFQRTSDATGPAMSVSAPSVTITNASVNGTDPCFWENTNPYNPASVGEKYSKWSAEKDPSGQRMGEHAALYVKPGAYNLTVNGITAKDVWGDGVTISGGQGVTINNLNARCVGRSGISITEGKDIVVDGGSTSGAFWWGINIEPFGSKQVSNVTIKGVDIGYTRYPWLEVGFGEGSNCRVKNVDVGKTRLLQTSSRPSRIQPCIASEVTKPSGDHS